MLTSNNLSSIFVLDQDRALDFYTGVLGLEVAADVAHQVARPAVPVTMFVAGLAAASSNPSDVLAWIEDRARAWTAEP